jgi:hypothetical protein
MINYSKTDLGFQAILAGPVKISYRRF